MTRPLVLWGAAGTLSSGLHLGLAAVLALAVSPKPINRQAVPETRMQLAAYAVEKSQAVAEDTGGEPAVPGQAEQTALSQGAIRQSVALPVAAKPEAAAVIATASTPLAASTASNTPLTASTASSTPLAASTESSTPLATSTASATALIAAPAAPAPLTPTLTTASTPLTASTDTATTLSTETAAPAPLPATTLTATSAIASEPAPAVTATLAVTGAQTAVADDPDIITLTAATAAALAADPVQAAMQTATPLRPATQPTVALQPAAPPAAPLQPASAMVAASALPAEHATAALAWSGQGDTSVDPVSLAAIQAFTQPGDLTASQSNAGQVRDGLEELLASVPCARLQVEFIPESGTLELRGHIPEAGLRAPLLDLLQSRVGVAIPVSDNLKILPPPQCGALAGIAAVGLPNSVDQQTNPLLVGAGAHAREYDYSGGERLAFELTAPDYPAWIYVDYFDANGDVIHLVPNETVPLTLQAAATSLSVGKAGNSPALNITIGPPFGQEIAVAFAASTPLYDGLRPFSEPAAAYLAWLKTRVADARAADPGFKGEWVYFFISTRQGG